MIGNPQEAPQVMTDFFDPDASKFEIVLDDVMGRCLQATAAIPAGTVIYQEQAFVYANNDGYNRFGGELFRAAFAKSILSRLDEIMDDLSEMSRVQSLDTAKNFLLLLALTKLRQLEQNEVLNSYFTHVGIKFNELIVRFNFLDQLTAANYKDCVKDVKSIRRNHPKLIPQSVSTEEAARLLGLVNTNQLELEDLGGSGLFLGTAVLQHDCMANCSYTTSNTTLYMCAVRDIQRGERLSIDYGNNYYHPTADRQDSLNEIYGFICNCQMCQGPDKKRPFVCEVCKVGVFCPLGRGEAIERDNAFSTCLQCNQPQSRSHIMECLAREEYFTENPPIDMESLNTLKSEGRLHESHHVVFWALDDLAMSLSTDARASAFTHNFKSNPEDLYRKAMAVLVEVVRILEMQLPAVHHEKVVYYDKLGQLAVALGDTALAKSYFEQAFNHSYTSSGSNVAATLALYKLATATPTSLSELLEHYSRPDEGQMDVEEWEDMDS